MSIDTTPETVPDTSQGSSPAPDGPDHTGRHTGRWTMVSAGLANVWRYGDLALDAPSGRLLLRGANGTGKTTALEALCPYLLDLNAQRLAAGKARTTTLAGLMSEGAANKRRTGYAWLTFSAPAGEEYDHPEQTWGVRLQYGPHSTPKVKVIAFTVPGRPLRDVPLYGPGRATLTAEDFHTTIENAGGRIFEDHEDYRHDLASTLWNAGEADVYELTSRIREVRNPNLLSEVSPEKAATALRASLPSVDPDVLAATADALAESETTRAAFDRDRACANQLAAFATTWTGHVAQVVGDAHAEANAAHTRLNDARRKLTKARVEAEDAASAASAARTAREDLRSARRRTEARLSELKSSEEFNKADHLTQLRAQAISQRRLADQVRATVLAAAARIAGAGRRHRTNLTELATAVTDTITALIDATHDPVTGPVIDWHDSPRATYPIGEHVANPGPGLQLTTTSEDLLDAADKFTDVGRQHSTRAESARTLVISHRATVIPAVERAESLTREADRAAAHRDLLLDRARDLTARAETVRGELLDDLTSWNAEHPDLATAPPTDTATTIEDLTTLADAEPSQVLTAVEEWREQVTDTGNDLIADAGARAERHDDQARRHNDDAEALLAEATELRAGKLLPLPRPAWAGPAAGHLFGEALTWHPDFTDPTARNQVESALADSGILGATLATDEGLAGADTLSTARWSVTAAGEPAETSLLTVLAVDPQHPHAEAAANILARIHLTDTAAVPAGTNGTEALAIGRDGTFRAGTLLGRPDTEPAPEASYVGARQRREAALQRAAALEAEAAAHQQQAATHQELADQARHRARTWRTALKQFPSTRDLTQAEAARSQAARNAHDAAAAAETALEDATLARRHATEAETEWVDSCRTHGLPTTIEALNNLIATAEKAAAAYSTAAKALRGPHIDRLNRILTDLAEEHTALEQLLADHSAAVREHNEAEDAEARVATHEELHGASTKQVLAAVDAASAELRQINTDLPAAETRYEQALAESSSKDAAVTHAEDAVTALAPQDAAARAHLRSLLDAPGVRTALERPDPEDEAASESGTEDRALSGPTAPAAPQTPAPGQVRDVLAEAVDLLAGHRRVAARTLRERYDQTKAELAGLGNVWTLENDDDIQGLSTFLLTHNDQVFTPAQAATEAERLALRAEEALASAEDAALRDFIIGQLPTAISVAWQRLLDWRHEVNAKMRSASASSGVGVQVDISPRSSMPPAVRTVYEICCKGHHGPGTSEEERDRVGKAIRSLIDAADEDTMSEKVAAAVDIRDWVDVRYEIQRPGQNPRTWTARTGLSGGERRLVVLAPMLAAVAATYDNLDPHGARLACLDEVPAEVDEAGREGLARYLAALDLDLMCTSYLWDGAPGAWDGIDAWDFEAAGDSTVVAFPMLVRGLDPFPTDPFPSHDTPQNGSPDHPDDP